MTGTSPVYNRSHALIIGVNDYTSASPLGYAVNDANAVAEILLNKFEFDANDIHILLDKDATRTAIHKAFLDFSGDSTHVDDRLLVFFAGHGHTVRSRRGDVGYLVPCDGDPADLSTLIRWDTLTRDADLIDAKHIFFVMDAATADSRSLVPSGRGLRGSLKTCCSALPGKF